MARSPGLRRSALRLLRGALIISFVTAVCYRTRLNAASTALLLLIAVVLQSLDCSFREAAVICVLATASLDYFFTEPRFSFAVSGPLEGITLVCLLTVTLVITRIQSRSRAEARESKLRRADMEGLYKVSQELLGLAPPTVAGLALLEPFLSAFEVAAVCLFDAATLESYAAGVSHGDLETKTRECFISGENASYPELGIVVQSMRARDKIHGAIGFEGLRNAIVTAPALAALAVAALERARAFRSATSAAVQAEAETLRSTILDALAHEFKTPLATILTAAGGLRVGGSAMPEQAELAEMIETEASRLGDLTTRLLRLARVDREDLKPRLLPANAAELAKRSIRRYSKLWPDQKISFRELEEVSDVHIDPELIGLAISQLVENACRYSPPDTNVRIELGTHDDMAAITVWNAGPPIAVGERDRIFERFYRGTEARRTTPGSGLGLYIARKIARAHGGDLALLDERPDEVGFRLTLPFSTDEVTGAEREL
jgi:two-component system, OmpR family, sensor histidine kinase KdpD